MQANIVDETKRARGEAGEVIRSLPGAAFEVMLNNDQKVLAHISGKIKLERSKILIGDTVTIARASTSDTNARIVFKHKI
ncbi:MAG: translation initiation factor IF-1 [Candidatus Hodgkinia cicadicola]